MTWPWWARVLHPAPASPSPSVQTERNTTPYVPAQARRVARWSGRPKPRRNMPRPARPTIQPSPDERFNMAVPPIASTRRAAPAGEGIPPPQIPPPARAGTRHDALPLSVRVPLRPCSVPLPPVVGSRRLPPLPQFGVVSAAVRSRGPRRRVASSRAPPALPTFRRPSFGIVTGRAILLLVHA